MLLLKVCHLLLRRPWLYDKKAQHYRFKNYTFKHGKKKMTMVTYPDVPNLKLKKTVGSYLLHYIMSRGAGILGPPLNSMGLSSYQREGIDAVAMQWMEKT